MTLERNDRIVVVGAGGFIGGHMIERLFNDGWRDIVAVDRKPPELWHQVHPAALNRILDTAGMDGARRAVQDARYVINLAADMGGIGFIERNKAACMLSVLSSTHLLCAAREHGCERFFFASSACVYPTSRQRYGGALVESSAYPAEPEDGYGWEKLFSERMCRHFQEDFGLETRVARFHNIYGPFGVYDGGREKAPAAICRKIIELKRYGGREIEIWGDGEQKRSFTYVDDCTAGTLRILASDVRQPLNLGSDELVTINQLVDAVEELAGFRVMFRRYALDAPQGVRVRNSDNRLIRKELGWEPKIRLAEGLEPTYRWIYDRMSKLGYAESNVRGNSNA
jgi:nucleoside-diphosphate-sugar epimerase